MLGIIFTREKMFAGMIQGKSLRWLQFGEQQNFVFHQGNFLQAIQTHLDQLLLLYQWLAPSAYGMTLQESLTIAIVLPGDNDFVSESEKNSIIDWVISDPIRCAAVQIDNCSNLLFSHFSLSRYKTPTIIFDAFDGDTLISTNFQNDFSNELPRIISNLGKKNGIKNIFNTFLLDFKKKNWLIDDFQQAVFLKMIERFPSNKSLKISIVSENSKAEIDLKLSESRYYDLLTSNRNLLKSLFLSYKKFDIYKISIIFASSFFDNAIFIDFAKHLFEEDLKINANLEFISDEVLLEKLLWWMFEKMSDNSFEAALPTRTQSRKKLFKEIQKKCTDRRKYRDYVSKYLTKARAIGIPDDVVVWHIRNAIYNPSALENIGNLVHKNVTLTPFYENKENEYYNLQLPSEALVSAEAIQTVAKQTNEFREQIESSLQSVENTKATQQIISASDTTSDADRATVIALSHHFIIQKWCSVREFLQFMGKLKTDTSNKAIIKVLKKQFELEKEADFRLLHERESSYFESTSPIIKENFGSYYFRPYYEGESLENYIKRTGLAQKLTIDALSANDIELILAIWNEVHQLKFTCPLDKRNFIVTIKRKLNLTKVIEVKIVNISTGTTTKEQLENDITSMLEGLLGYNLYHELHHDIQNRHL